jgi:hypothetical protein
VKTPKTKNCRFIHPDHEPWTSTFTCPNTSARGRFCDGRSSYLRVTSGPGQWKIFLLQWFLSYLCFYSPLLAAFSVSWSFTKSVGFLRRGISPYEGRYLHTGQHKHRINAETYLSQAGFKPTIPVSERAKTLYVLDRAATGIGSPMIYVSFQGAETSLEISLHPNSLQFDILWSEKITLH